MTMKVFCRIWTFALIIICSKYTVETCIDDQLYVIRSTASNGLVLDATEPSQVKIQPYIGSDPQLWSFQRGNRPGLFYIANSATGKVLDVQSDSLVVNTRRNSIEQQWFLDSRGKITNAHHLKNADIQGAKFKAGVALLLWKDNFDENINQKFIFQQKPARGSINDH